jgi:predicted nucleotidyltransferase
LANFCKQHHIVEFSLFGSVLRPDFREDSDIDVLVVFDSNPQFRLGLMDLVKISYELEDLFGRKVDLVERESIETSHNWLRRREILNTAQVIYESRSILSAGSS